MKYLKKQYILKLSTSIFNLNHPPAWCASASADPVKSNLPPSWLVQSKCHSLTKSYLITLVP